MNKKKESIIKKIENVKKERKKKWLNLMSMIKEKRTLLDETQKKQEKNKDKNEEK